MSNEWLHRFLDSTAQKGIRTLMGQRWMMKQHKSRNEMYLKINTLCKFRGWRHMNVMVSYVINPSTVKFIAINNLGTRVSKFKICPMPFFASCIIYIGFTLITAALASSLLENQACSLRGNASCVDAYELRFECAGHEWESRGKCDSSECSCGSAHWWVPHLHGTGTFRVNMSITRVCTAMYTKIHFVNEMVAYSFRGYVYPNGTSFFQWADEGTWKTVTGNDFKQNGWLLCTNWY